MSNYPNEKTRMARIEAITNKQRAEQPDAQLDALNAAIERNDEETAAEIARTIRNRLLKDTDAEVALDRLGLTVPTGSTFTAWLDFFRHLGEALVGSWAQYRQALRDLPNQEGFPFAIAWPERPDAESDNQEGRQA
ncbi:MAG: phage tail assembly chaperone [Clostridia bacterium]|nr:phage tail assembly chaperone [Clostridia bacterium]